MRTSTAAARCDAREREVQHKVLVVDCRFCRHDARRLGRLEIGLRCLHRRAATGWFFIDTDWRQGVETATTLSAASGSVQVQDGPFAETKETLGGFFMIDVPDLDTALEWAGKCRAHQL